MKEDDITIHVNEELPGQLSIPEDDLPEDREGSSRYMRFSYYIDKKQKIGISNIKEDSSHEDRIHHLRNVNWRFYQLFSVRGGAAFHTSGVVENNNFNLDSLT